MRTLTTFLSIITTALLTGLHPALAQQSIEVEAGQNMLLEALAQAMPGDTLLLTTDGGQYPNDDELRVEMPLTIMATPGSMNRPILTNNGEDATKDIIRMYDDLTLIGLELDGLAQEGKQTKYGIRNSSGSDQADLKDGYVLKILDCYFHDFVHGSDGNAFRAYYDTMADSIIVRNTLVRNTGKEAIRVRDEDNERPGFGFFNVKYFEVSNSTFWDIKNDAISVYGGDEDPSTPGPEVVIKNVTMHNVGHYFINLKDVENATVTNTIMVNNYDIVNLTNKSLGAPWLVPGSQLLYSDTLNVSDDGDWTGDRGDPTIESLYAVDPMFVDPENGDFTLMENSPLIGAGMGGVTLGDPRWWGAGVTPVSAGQNTLLEAVAQAAPGDILELVDSGGEYVNDNNINITMPLTIRAAAGLAERPVIRNNEPDESTRVLFDIFDSLHLDGVELDGQAGTDFNAKYMLRIRNSSDYPVNPTTVLKVTNSYIHDVIAGSDGNFLRQYTETLADSVIFRNSIMNNSGKEGIRIKDESSERPNEGFFNVKYFEVSNTTMANTRQAAIYVYAGDDDPSTEEPEFVVSNLTCYNCGFGNGRAIWPRDMQNAQITSSIIANSNTDADWSVRLYGNSTISYSDTFMVAPVQLDGSSMADTMYNIEPEFTDPENLDFSLPATSPLVVAGPDGLGIGDMRWITERVAVDHLQEIPEITGFLLGQNYPNPFHVQTTIPYRMEREGHVTLELYDLLGRRVARLKDNHETAGDHTVTISMQHHAPGTYFYKLSVDDQTLWRKLVLAR